MKFNRIIAIILATLFCFSMTVVAYATDAEATTSNTTPEYGQILYEDSNIVIMAGNPDNPEASLNSLTSDYNYAWVESGYNHGTFTVYSSNSSPFGITLKIESNDSSAYALCTVYDPYGNTLEFGSVSLYPGFNNGEGFQGIVANSPAGYYTIEYHCTSTAGTRIMCWVY